MFILDFNTNHNIILTILLKSGLCIKINMRQNLFQINKVYAILKIAMAHFNITIKANIIHKEDSHTNDSYDFCSTFIYIYNLLKTMKI